MFEVIHIYFLHMRETVYNGTVLHISCQFRDVTFGRLKSALVGDLPWKSASATYQL